MIIGRFLFQPLVHLRFESYRKRLHKELCWRGRDDKGVVNTSSKIQGEKNTAQVHRTQRNGEHSPSHTQVSTQVGRVQRVSH